MTTRWQLRMCVLVLSVVVACAACAGAKDVPFRQEVRVAYRVSPELEGVAWLRLGVDRDGVAYALTDKGVARLFEGEVALDRGFRPLAGRVARDITTADGRLFYLFDEALLSNGFAGKYLVGLPKGTYERVAVGWDHAALLAGQTNLAVVRGGQLTPLTPGLAAPAEQLYAWGNRFFVLASNTIYRVTGTRVEVLHRGKNLTALGFRGGEVFVGTHRGYYALDWQSGRATLELQTKLPALDITSLAVTTNGVWAGTTRGVFFEPSPGVFRYYASRRWLNDDYVVAVQPAPNGDVFVLTRKGLNKLEGRTMTLAQKAAYYDDLVRRRHIRYGFCAELRLGLPGDPASGEMIDTDNDGSWSSYYLASQAFRYAATGEPQARANAWETFEALERLQTINPLNGFPARTFERRGFKVSDPERWHTAPNPNWEWKAHTSSDEITAQTFAMAVLYETAARTTAEQARIAELYDRIVAHILRNDLYLVDVDGKPTLWGRWNPEYVNHYPPSISDRRLNSSEIIAFLQFAYHLTRKDEYRRKALELLEGRHYLQNITNTVAAIGFTPGYVYQGNDMGSEWNHSDDLLAFVNYWTLYRYAFNDVLRRQYALAIRDHWVVESVERCPVWNFVYAMTGAVPYDLEGAMWTLRRFPLDLVTWTVINSQRADLTRLASNFRRQETEQLLPPDERPLTRWNGNPFTLDGGNGGLTELAGDEFLLPYWMGRYLGIIQ